MKQLTKFTPLLARFSTALLLVVMAMPQPALAGGLIGACRSFVPNVSVHYTTRVHKKCFWDCLTGIVLNHDNMKMTIVDFEEPDFSGSLSVAVLPNDSRLPSRNPIGKRKFADLTWASGLTGWYKIDFHGLKPEHHYAVVIYSPDEGYGIEKPFYRQCFWTDKDPKDCPPDARKNYHGVPQC